MTRMTPFAALICLVAFATSAIAQTNRVTFPTDFAEMKMYGDYRRGTGGELAYALPETIETAKKATRYRPARGSCWRSIATTP